MLPRVNAEPRVSVASAVRSSPVFALVDTLSSTRPVPNCIWTPVPVKSRLPFSCRVGSVPLVVKLSPTVKSSLKTKVALFKVNPATDPPETKSRVPLLTSSSPPETLIAFSNFSFPAPLEERVLPPRARVPVWLRTRE